MKKKTWQRVLALSLALIFTLGMLASCGKTEDVVEDGGDRVNGSWDSVDFGGQVVRFCISTNQYEECTFPAANIYTKGPDQAGSNEVAKEVIARNTAAAKDLGVTIEYSERSLRYPEVHEDIRKIVQTSATNSPDIYNNDLIGLGKAMVDGLLWNVKNPGDVKNYFDFEADGWYTEYIKGCTFDQEKLYIFAGDYFIDMIRMAWVILVNNDILESNLKKMPEWCGSVSEFYEYIDSGMWDLDMLGDMANRVFVDSGIQGATERKDTLVGFSMNHVTNWIISASSGITLYYQDENYAPKVMQSIDDYQKVSNKYKALAEKPGVYLPATATVEGVLDSTTHFLEGTVLFAASRLGEMESTALRDFSANKGITPFPKWNGYEQDEYHTTIHNQVELGAILSTARAYSAASALMQYLNEESEQVVYTYYEKGLKYKYNDDENARIMMDIIRDTTDSPFGFEIGDICQTLYTGSGTLKGLYIKDTDTIRSTFASEKDAYNDCMAKMIEKFKALE